MTAAAESAVRDLLRGDRPPRAFDTATLQAAWRHAIATSVDELVARVLLEASSGVPDSMADQARACLRDAHARDMVRFTALQAIVVALTGRGIPALLMKGAGLAYTAYASPELRPSDDVDVLVAPEQLPAAAGALEAAGYTRALEPDADLAATQCHYVRAVTPGVEHIVDLHWSASNRLAFAGVLEFGRAWAESIEIPRLAGARTLGAVDALLLACTHRVAHHDDDPTLLWLWDIHLLVSRLTPAQLEDAVERATRARVAVVVAHSLEQAQRRLGTPVEAALLDRLRTATGELSARFVGGSLRPVDQLGNDLWAARSASRRLTLLREHLVPAWSYMRRRYPGWPVVLLPLAYVYRAARGAPRWFRPG